MRFSLIFAPLLAVACAQPHENGAIEVSGRSDCVTCHLADYQGATNPVHVGTRPTTCGDCHTTNAWRPAADGIHPESAFPIHSGPHQGITCLDCHDPARGTYADGANTVCTRCHTRGRMDDTHNEVGSYAWDDNRPNFCLTCHPRGFAEGD